MVGTKPSVRHPEPDTSFDRQFVIDAGKAVYDAVMHQLPGLIQKALEDTPKVVESVTAPKFKSLETGLTTQVKSLVEHYLGEMIKSHEGRLSELQQVYQETVPHLKAFDDKAEGIIAKAMDRDFANRIAYVVKTYEDQTKILKVEHAKTLAELKAGFDKSLADYADRYDKSLVSMRDVIGSIPAPVIHFPESAVKVLVEQSTPIVNIHDGALTVSLEKLLIPSPVVNVKAADLPAPVVNIAVEMPPMIKTFEYDENGRPTRVIEKKAGG